MYLHSTFFSRSLSVLVILFLPPIFHVISDAFAGDLQDGLSASAGLKKKKTTTRGGGSGYGGGGRGVGGAGTVLGGTERERKERRAKRERGYLSTMLSAAKVRHDSNNSN